MSQLNLKLKRVQPRPDPNFKNGKVRIELDSPGVATMEATLKFLLSVEKNPTLQQLWLKLYRKRNMLLSIPYTMTLHLWEAHRLYQYMGQITELPMVENNNLVRVFQQIYDILGKYKNLQV
jgi:hypothetical protein